MNLKNRHLFTQQQQQQQATANGTPIAVQTPPVEKLPEGWGINAFDLLIQVFLN